MQIRWKRVKTDRKVYQYAELVESYRRKSDGMATKRVIANLGVISQDMFDNLSRAFQASRDGKRVVTATTTMMAPGKPADCLRYLDVAALLEIWRRYGLAELCTELLPPGDKTASPADVITTLVLHRCCDAGSKLHATRWYPRTALPELLGLDPAAFGNSRLHRDLELLSQKKTEFERRLPALYRANSGPGSAFSALYVDISDATFEGAGPELARKGRAKDDVIRQRVGIVLLCNERGYPLSWDVLPGNAPEAPALIAQMKRASTKSWGRGVPIVGDRALGKTAYIRELLDADVSFVTAMARTEFPTYAPVIPFATFTALETDALVDELRRLGFEELEQKKSTGKKAKTKTPQKPPVTMVRDLGLVVHAGLACAPPSMLDTQNPGKDALLRLREIHELMQTHGSRKSQAAQQLGYDPQAARKWEPVTKLVPEIQEAILADEAIGISVRNLTKISRLKPDEQRDALDALVARRDAGDLPKLRATNFPITEEVPGRTEVRVVVYFNSEILEHRREKVNAQLRKIQTFVDRLNTAASVMPQTEAELRACVERKLRKASLLTAFDIRTSRAAQGDRQVARVEVCLRHDDWAARRALDGFSVLVTHPNVTLPAVDVVRLYRSKDTVEKDFQTIKSVLEMLPVRHRSDVKVEAHVTICVLALLLQRLMRDELAGTMSAEQAQEHLEPCRLLRYGSTANSSAYLLTQETETQRKILTSLGLGYLVDDSALMDVLEPR